VPASEYLVGLVFAVATLGTSIAAAALVLRRRLRHLTGAAAVLALAVLACAALLAAHLVPGMIGLLSRGPVLLAGVVLLAAVAVSGGDRGPAVRRLRLRVPDPGATAGVVGAGLAAAWSVAWAWRGTATASTDVDTLTFHLPDLAKWIQRGSIWPVDQFTPLLASGNYPHNGDVLLLSTVLPFRSDAFVRAAGLPFLAVAAVAVYALCLQTGARRSTAALLGGVTAALPVLQVAAFEGAKTDAPMLAMLGAGTYFLVRHLREPRRSDLVLAGLGLGIAFGTKWYALWCVPIVVLAWAGVALWGGRPRRQVIRAVGGLTGLVALAGGLWLVRNVIESGSPLFPSSLGLGPITVFDTPRDYFRDCAGFSIAGYLDDPGVVRHLIVPAWRQGYAGPGLVLALGWITATGLLLLDRLRHRRREVPPALWVAVIGAPLMAAAYLAAPYSAIGGAGQPVTGANLRWLVPAALPAAAATAWALTCLPRVRPIAEALIVVAIFDALSTTLGAPLQDVALPVAGLTAVLAAGVGTTLLWRRGDVASRASALGAAAALIAVLALVGYIRQDSYLEHRYRGSDAVISALARSGADERRVALSGVWGGGVLSPVLPAFGPRLRGRVEFIGPTVSGQLREYSDRRAWTAAVRRGRYDLLVVGRNGYRGLDCLLPGREGDDDAWAAQSGYLLLARTYNLSLYRVPRS